MSVLAQYHNATHGLRTIRDWLSRIDKDSKEARNKRIFELWLADYTNQEIADRESLPKGTVDGLCLEMANLPDSSKPTASHLTDFEVPLYNVFGHFGNSEVRWLI